MKLIKSQLELIDFYVINADYKFVDPPPQETIDVKKLFSSYEIDFDFMPRNDDGQYLVYIKVKINKIENPLAGYSLFTEGVCLFGFSEEENLSEGAKSDFVWTSGVSIAINNIRNYITNMTAYCPLGKYNLPAVNLTAVINEKRTELSLNKKIKNKKG